MAVALRCVAETMGIARASRCLRGSSKVVIDGLCAVRALPGLSSGHAEASEEKTAQSPVAMNSCAHGTAPVQWQMHGCLLDVLWAAHRPPFGVAHCTGPAAPNSAGRPHTTASHHCHS